MSDYTITITSAEEKALKTVMVNIKEWITNLTEVRAAQATKEITTKLLEHCNANDIAIATGLVVTKSASDESLGSDVGHQIPQ